MTISAISFRFLRAVQMLKCPEMYFTLEEKSVICMFIVLIQEECCCRKIREIAVTFGLQDLQNKNLSYLIRQDRGS